MVFLTSVLGYVKRIPRKYLRKGIIDKLRLYVKAGNGGSGLPDYGGRGGVGGNVYVVSKERLTLESVASKWKEKRLHAESGSNSTRKGIAGLPGKDITIEVPTGITVYTEDGFKLGELDKENAKILVAKGGVGGCSETGYCGLKGQTHTIVLDLKLIADVGLVGFPNAGKSTLLNAISKAKPKIASYPFTTIRPQLGTILYEDGRKITIADLPGLIEGAHANIGMGHKFLKHIERTKLLLFVVDIQGFQLSHKYDHRSCLETVVLLNKELELYKPDLLNMSSMLIINKMDTKNASNIYAEIKEKLMELSHVILDFPEEMRPEKVLRFNNIMTASLALKKPDEIAFIKQQIRDILDENEEKRLLSEQDALTDAKLFEQLKQEARQHVPTLV